MSVRFPALAFPALVLGFASPGSGGETRAGAYIGAGFFEADREVPNPGTDYSARPGLSAGAVLTRAAVSAALSSPTSMTTWIVSICGV